MIGVERDDRTGLTYLGKHNQSYEMCREVFSLFREKYPEVYTIGSVIYGIPGDSHADLRRLIDCGYRLGMDFCFFIPLTPNPGADFVDEESPADASPVVPLTHYNFHTPVRKTRKLGLRDLEGLWWRSVLRGVILRPVGYLKPLFKRRSVRVSRIHRALVLKASEIGARSLVKAVLHPRDVSPSLCSRRPSWYDD